MLESVSRHLIFVLLSGYLAFAPTAARAESVKVFAAASLKNAIDEIAASWKASTGKEAVASYAASSALAKQIIEGAPADIFVSADIPWMDAVAEKNLIATDSRKNLLGNTLVLVATAGSGKKIELKSGADLAGLLGDSKLAVADVKAVPAGKYAKAALETLGLWPSVEKNLAMSENVRAALALVARGEAPLGIVYGSDAKSEGKVEVAGVFPQDSHPPIIYPVALISASANPDAKEFLSFLSSDGATAVFEKQGFEVLK